MPEKCCVPNCRTNYRNGPKNSIFRFPTSEDMQKKWIAAIPRKNLKITKYARVCAVHFKDSDILKESSGYTKEGQKISVPLEKYRLQKFAVPSIFPGCPNYFNILQQTRESPAEKQVRIENGQLALALKESLQSKEKEDNKFLFTNYLDFLKCLDVVEIPSCWDIIRKENVTKFILFAGIMSPHIKCCVIVKHNLEVSAFIGGAEVTFYKSDTFPVKIGDLRNLLKILNYIHSLTDGKELNFGKFVSSATQDLLSNMKEYFEGNETVLTFLSEQVGLLSCDKSMRRYSPETLIFSTLLFSISPHAYNFLRHSGNVIIPHPKTIQNISSNYHVSPIYEQSEANFLHYAKEKYSTLDSHERYVTLMVDAIHIKEYFDYKGGNVVGTAFNNNEGATSAHVFMVRSLLSSYKDVVHILPVNTITGEILHSIIKKIILGLEKIGFMVICVVSDNISVNRKAMTLFSDPPELKILYLHPNSAKKRPLFFVIDTVHILKNVRNNWLNQKNIGQCMFYPDFEHNTEIKTASFGTLKRLHEIEKNDLVTYNHTLTFKALNPNSLERQNVPLVLKLFNPNVITALQELGNKCNLEFHKDTANYIELIYKWWCIMNVKSPRKGIRHRNVLMNPLTVEHDEKMEFLAKFQVWLDAWKSFGLSTGKLTNETHEALSHSTYALLEMSQYCIEELGFQYFLCGKVQTDALEERFGKYRYLAGSQYHVSIRQIFECESKLRLQNSLPLTVKSNAFGNIPINKIDLNPSWDGIEDNIADTLHIDVNEEDLESDGNILPVLTYLAGYCVYSVYKHLKCEECHFNLTIERDLICDDDMYGLISSLDRGALKYPTPDSVFIIHFCFAVIKKLLSAEHETEFLKSLNQRALVMSIAFHIVSRKGFVDSTNICSSGHTSKTVVKRLLWIACNIFLKDYVGKRNDKPLAKKTYKKRKLETLKPSVHKLLAMNLDI